MKKIIESSDLKNWKARASQEKLPELLNKLIHVTSPEKIISLNMVSGDDIALHGYDGVLNVSEASEYYPSGLSVWEIKTNRSGIRKQADTDYEKRKLNPGIPNPSQCTFIFATNRTFEDANEWIEEKKKDNFWKDIRVVNASTLESWLETAPTVGFWLARELKIMPPNGIELPETYFKNWSTNPQTEFCFDTTVLLAGRELQTKKLIKLAKSRSIVTVEAPTVNEAVSFIVCSYLSSKMEVEDFLSRALIVESMDALKQLCQFNKSLLLIPTFENEQAVNLALQYGHKIILPLAPDSNIVWSDKQDDKIILPRAQHEPLTQALIKSGIPKEEASRLSRESFGNINVLRRRLIPSVTPKWATSDNLPILIPAILVGQWNEDTAGDKEIVSLIAGMSYETYIEKLFQLKLISDSPIINIGSSWRIQSPLDSWQLAAKYITPFNYEKLKSACDFALNEIHPKFELESDQRFMAQLYNKVSKYSNSIKSGLIQSLTIISVFAKEFKINLQQAEYWVDIIVANILKNESPDFWKTIETFLPALSEASPDAFLNSVEKVISSDSNSIHDLITEEKSVLFPLTYISGLLHALENTAWLPEKLSQTTIILGKIANFEIGYQSNGSSSAFKSLLEIYKPWHHQTRSSLEERLASLKLLGVKNKEIGWKLFLALLPKHGGIATGTQRMRWRISTGYENKFNPEEYRLMNSGLVDLLIGMDQRDEKQLANLLDESTHLLQTDYEIDRLKIFKYVEDNKEKIRIKDFSIWHALRKILIFQISNSESEWTFSADNLKPYQRLYELYEPDEIEKSLWVFNEQWPTFVEHPGMDLEDRDDLIRDKRIENLMTLYNNYGIKKIIELSQKVEYPNLMGDVLANINLQENDLDVLYECLKSEGKTQLLIYGFMFRVHLMNGDDYCFELFKKLKDKSFDESELARILIPLRANKNIWNFISNQTETIQSIYWKNVHPYFVNFSKEDKNLGVNTLIKYNRGVEAMMFTHHHKKEMENQTLLNLLESVAKSGFKDEEVNSQSIHYVEELFEELDERTITNIEMLAKLEWWYLPFLSGHGHHRAPKVLHNEMSSNPIFFIEILKFFYRHEDDSISMKEIEGMTPDDINHRTKKAYQLLESWDKIPGIDKDGKIDKDFLWDWINKVRELSYSQGRGNRADHWIGGVLSQYPKGENWPPVEICEVIERINTEELKNSFSVGVFNGQSILRPANGGLHERQEAEFYSSVAKRLQNSYPQTAAIMFNLSKSYLRDAADEHKQAERDNFEY